MSINQEQNDIESIKDAWETQIFDENKIYNLVKNLSKLKDENLLEVLRVSLSSKNDFWRNIAVDKLIYYKEKINHHDIELIKKIIETDEIDEIKISAASLLAYVHKDSEDFLYKRLRAEKNKHVLAALVESILAINEIPPYLSLPFSDQISAGEIQISDKVIKDFIHQNSR
jgi:ribonuclease HII